MKVQLHVPVFVSVCSLSSSTDYTRLLLTPPVTHSAQLGCCTVHRVCLRSPPAAPPLFNLSSQELIITSNNLQEVTLWCEKLNYNAGPRDLHPKHRNLCQRVLHCSGKKSSSSKSHILPLVVLLLDGCLWSTFSFHTVWHIGMLGAFWTCLFGEWVVCLACCDAGCCFSTVKETCSISTVAS